MCGAVGIERAGGPLDEAALVDQQHNDEGEHLLLLAVVVPLIVCLLQRLMWFATLKES